jgi:hypothetical protein
MMRLSQKNKRGCLLFVLCGMIFSVSAQRTFKYEAAINKVDSTGFYKIGLSPVFIAKSNIDLSDIRLVDQKGHFVPYITADNLPQADEKTFVVFPQVLITSKADTGTTFVIESKEKVPVNRLWVKLKNTAVSRSVNLLGSDDLNRWFAIKEGIPLQEAELNSDGAYLQSLSFPASNYHYLKLLVNDKNKAAIKFLEAGIYTERSLANLYFPIPQAKFVKKDSNQVTNIIIELNDNYLVNELTLDITGPKYYKRDASIYQVDKQNHMLICNSELNSNRPSSIFLSVKTNRLELQIANGDNLPLNINKIEVSQADQYITSYLEAGQTYKLLTGDTKAEAPDYDLKFFTDSIHKHLPEIGHGFVKENSGYNIQSMTVKHEYPWIIWAALVVVLILLTLLTFKMMNAVNNKKPGA